MIRKSFAACQIVPTKRTAENSRIPTFDTVALFGDVQVQLKLIRYKNLRITLQELLQTAATTTRSDHLLKGWVVRPFKNSLKMILEQYPSMGWLLSTLVAFSQETQHAPPIFAAIQTDLRLPLKKQQMVKNILLSEEGSYGIASQLSQSKHPPLVYLTDVIGFLLFFF